MKRLQLALTIVFMLGLCLTSFAQTVISGAVPELVHDANPSGDGGASNITSVGDFLFYEANGALWMYDGSAATAVTVSSGTYQHMVGQFNDELYYIVEDGSSIVLRRHNGAVETTVANLGTATSVQQNIYATNTSEMFFIADDGSYGLEIWSTDGSTAARITDINASGGSSPENLMVLEDELYFTAIPLTDRDVYKYDGSAVSRVSLRVDSFFVNVPDGDGFAIESYDGDIFFIGKSTFSTENVVFRVNNTSGGILSSPSAPTALKVLDDNLYIYGGIGTNESFYINDGNSVTRQVTPTGLTDVKNLNIHNDQLFFTVLATANGKTFFANYDGGNTLDGSGEGATHGYDSYVPQYNYVFYSEENGDGTQTMKIAPYGSFTEHQVFDINASESDQVSGLTLHKDVIYFESDNGINGKELMSLRYFNETPEITSTVTDQTVVLADGPLSFDLSTFFIDADNDALTYSVSSSDEAVATTSMSGNDLVINLLTLGITTITITADDSFMTTEMTFNIDVVAPYLSFEGSGFTESNDNDGSVTGNITVEVSGDSFVNGGGFLNATHYVVDNLPTGLTSSISVDAAGEIATLTFSGNADLNDDSDDLAAIILTFTDAAFASGDVTNLTNAVAVNTGLGISYLNNPTPTLPYSMNDVVRVNGASSVYYDLEKYFAIEDGTTLTYTATSSDVNVGPVVVDGEELRLTVGDIGTTTITVTATASSGSESIDETFVLTVQEPFLTYGEYVGILEESNLTLDTVQRMEFAWGSIFGTDGTRSYRPGRSGINQLDLNVAYDISEGFTTDYVAETGAYTGRANELFFDMRDEIGLGATDAVEFNSDGSKMYVTYNNYIYQYSLNDPFELRGGATLDIKFDLGTRHYDLRMKPDDSGFLALAFNSRSIVEYSFNVPGSIPDGLVNEGSTSLQSERPDMIAYSFNYDGTEIITSDLRGFEVAIFSLNTPYTLLDGYTFKGSLTVPSASEYGQVNGALFGPDGKLYVIMHADLNPEDGLNTLNGYLMQYNHSDRIGGFTETEANDGTVEGEMLISLTGDSFVNAGGTLISGTHFSIDNLPSGLTPAITVNSLGNQAKLTLTGQASSHTAADNIAALLITFTNAAFEENTAANFTNAINANTEFNISFINNTVASVAASIGTSSSTVDLEEVFGDLTDITISTEVSLVTAVSSEFINERSISNNLPIKSELNAEFRSNSGGENIDPTSIARIEIENGIATITPLREGDISVSFAAQGATSEEGAIPAAPSVDFDLAVDAIGPYLFFEGDEFAENNDNYGELNGSWIISVVDDTFVKVGDELVEGVHYTLSQEIAGLTPSLLVSADGTQTTLTFSGYADDHDDVDNMIDLSVLFSNDAFAGGDASVVANAISSSTGFGIDFIADEAIVWEAGTWSNGTGPTQSDIVQIKDHYSIDNNGTFKMASLQIASNGMIEVTNGTSLDVTGDLIVNGQLVVTSGSSLFTYEGNDCVGEVTFKRNTTHTGNQYSMVGIPVTGTDVIGADLGTFVFGYDEGNPFNSGTDDGLNRWVNKSAEILESGKGYAAAGQKEIVFTGAPKDGTISFNALSRTEDATTGSSNWGWHLLSNPYGTALDLEAFLTTNTGVQGFVALWDDPDSENGRGDNGDYLIVNALGMVNGPNGGTFEGYVGSMQGFFVQVGDGQSGDVTFTEDMRIAGNNGDGTFFREEIGSITPSVKLQMRDDEGNYSETLIGLTDKATSGMDRLYDASKLKANVYHNIYSNINGEPFAIQGLPLTDYGVEIPLGIDRENTGIIEIALSDESVLPQGYQVAIYDNEIKDYTFLNEEVLRVEIEAGIKLDRFKLVIKPVISNVVKDVDQSQQIQLIEASETQVRIKYSGERELVAIYDLSGKKVTENEVDFVSGEGTLSLQIETNQIYVIKINQEIIKFRIDE